jgi:hypothetical protein
LVRQVLECLLKMFCIGDGNLGVEAFSFQLKVAMVAKMLRFGEGHIQEFCMLLIKTWRC